MAERGATTSVAVTVPMTIGSVLLVAWVMYHRFELPTMQLGKRFGRPVPVPAHVR